MTDYIGRSTIDLKFQDTTLELKHVAGVMEELSPEGSPTITLARHIPWYYTGRLRVIPMPMKTWTQWFDVTVWLDGNKWSCQFHNNDAWCEGTSPQDAFELALCYYDKSHFKD